jgi:uncharacterized protein YcgI (DUF1989 family)
MTTLTLTPRAAAAAKELRRSGETDDAFMLRMALAARVSGHFGRLMKAPNAGKEKPEAPPPDGMSLREEFVIPKERGRAFEVYAGEVLRVIEVDGPQTCDFNAFVLPDFKEAFSAGRTRFFTGAHPRKGDPLYTNPPHERIMFRIVEDTVDHTFSETGATAHDLTFPRCSEIVFSYPFGIRGHRGCQDSLAEAIAPYSLTPDDVHDTLNLFMKCGVDRAGMISIEAPDAVKGDYVDLACEVDSLVVISSCPAGGVHATNAEGNKPLKVRLYRAKERDND